MAALLGCSGFVETSSWRDQITPDGPCYDANLLDGLDEASTRELHDVFACVNGSGSLDHFAAYDRAFDTDTRDGPMGLVLARMVNDLGGDAAPEDTAATGEGLGALLGDLRATLDDPTPLFDALHQGLELAWGRPWSELGLQVDVRDPAALDASIAAPALRVAGPAATALLDHEGALAPLGGALRSPELRQLAWLVVGLAEGTDPAFTALRTRWADDVAELLGAVKSPDNDRWAGASGDSLRDLLDAAVLAERDGHVALVAVLEPLAPMLEDGGAEARILAALGTAAQRGELEALPQNVMYLLSLDARGGALEPGEDSALAALLRLLATTNRPVDCTVAGIIPLRSDNLAVQLLHTFADLDPDSASSGIDLLSSLLGFGVSDAILETIPETCPEIDDHFPEDVHAIERLVDPGAQSLLHVMLGLLDALDSDAEGEVDHVAALCDTVTNLYAAALLPPLEELLRDVILTTAVADVVDLVPVLLDPSAHYAGVELPEGASPPSVDTLWVAARAALTAGEDGTVPLDTLSPLLPPLLGDDQTWLCLDRLAALLAEPAALSRGLLTDLGGALGDALREDPSLPAADTLADGLEDLSSLRPVLVMLEGEGLREATLSTSTELTGPLPTLTVWTMDGTFAVLIDTVDVLLTLLPSPDDTAP